MAERVALGFQLPLAAGEALVQDFGVAVDRQ